MMHWKKMFDHFSTTLKSMLWVSLFLTGLVGLGGQAIAQDHYFKTKASHAVILDYETGEILYRKQAEEQMAPASMTKLMTAAIVMDMLKSGELTDDTLFTVSEKAWRTGGSKMFVLVNTEISVKDLLTGIIVVSGNDACVVVAENISGSVDNFAKLMNEKARAWGMSKSHFTNPNGLPDPNHVMSAVDLAKLTQRIIRDYPEYYKIFSTAEFTWSKITQGNRNPLLKSFDGADGMKTGHTEISGFGLVGTAFKDQQRRIVVLNGLETATARARESTRLMGLAFSEFDSRLYFTPGDVLGTAPVFMGTEDEVPLYIKNEVGFTMHNKALDGAKAKIVYSGPLQAPIAEGDQVATLKIDIPNNGVREYPLYAQKAVPEIGALGKIKSGLAALLTPPSTEDIR